MTSNSSEKANEVEEKSVFTIAYRNVVKSEGNDYAELAADISNTDSSVIDVMPPLFSEIKRECALPQIEDGPQQSKSRTNESIETPDKKVSEVKFENSNENNDNNDDDGKSVFRSNLFTHNINKEAMEVGEHTFNTTQNLNMFNNFPRKLSFDDDHHSFGLAASPSRRNIQFNNEKQEDSTNSNSSFDNLICQENQHFGSPPPVYLDSIFPSSGLDDLSSFPPFQSQYHIDDSYSANLLGSAFIPSPQGSRTPSSPSNAAVSLNPFAVNMHDIRAHCNDPTLNTNQGNSSLTNHCPLPLVKSLPSLGTQGYNKDEKFEYDDEDSKKFVGKTIDNLHQISASVTRNNRSKRPRTRKLSRNLPLRKRHASLESDQNDDIMTTPVNTTRSSDNRHLVSRSVSAERNKRGSSLHIQPSRNRSRRQGGSRLGKSFSSNKPTSGEQFNHVSVPSFTSDGTTRVIQHFTPKRHTVPILSSERSLPNTVIFGCKCSKSKCLKLYCDCFQAGQVCSDRCGCKDCLNTLEESGKNGRRTAAIQSILDRRPDAFDVRVKKTGEGCSCKKNRCLKKYCDCFNTGIKCNPEQCRCVDCQNYPSDDDHQSDVSDVSTVYEKNEIDYEVENTNMSDFQISFHQDDDDQSDFMAAVSRKSFIDEKPHIFQEDVTAV